jgi:hypothetical protein
VTLGALGCPGPPPLERLGCMLVGPWEGASFYLLSSSYFRGSKGTGAGAISALASSKPVLRLAVPCRGKQ